ncbi:LiaF domain-containing protein [uncultured Bacteroides sp.]|uniref:LiaF domain-containing protein n=1 Tax=uncultured Bacteroides sp. TaxID=162156 RepID=UPI002AA84CC5|nr:LiaF domain-containing protein [uncultured Bacteroides sp.]
MKTCRKNHHRKHTAFFAALLIISGLVFLGFNLGFMPLPFKTVLFSWPMFVLLIGVASLFRYHFWSGSCWFIVGTFFLIPRVLTVYPDFLPLPAEGFVHMYWPVLLILGGIIFLIRLLVPHHCMYHNTRKRFTDKFGFDECCGNETSEKIKAEYTRGYFNKQSVFSSGKYIVLDPVFKGGEVNTVFGDTTLDLRKTNLADGDTVLCINTVLGNVTVYVPVHWTVDIKIDAIIYTFKDMRIDKEQTDTTKRLIIEGGGVLGSGDLRN